MNNSKILIPAVAAFALVGCSTVRPGCRCDGDCNRTCRAAPYVDGRDPVIGNWSAKLPFDRMYAGSLIFSRGEKGEAKAFVLFRASSPVWCSDVSIEGNRFSFRHPSKYLCHGEVDGDTFVAELARCDKEGRETEKLGKFEGWRNAPACPCATSKGVKLGKGIDLLKDGLDGWQTMNPKGRFGWTFKDGVLSNALGLKADGTWAGGGANLMSKRNDFGDFNLEYDVRVPKNSNSGVYLRGRFEIQVLDTYGRPVDCHNMAAYYGRVAPRVAAEKPAGEWQHVSVTLANRHLTVVLNGVTIIDDVVITGVTGGAIDADMDAPGPIYLQGDHSDADFRNMILRPVVK